MHWLDDGFFHMFLRVLLTEDLAFIRFPGFPDPDALPVSPVITFTS